MGASSPSSPLSGAATAPLPKLDKRESLKKQMGTLVARGELLYFSMLKEREKLNKSSLAQLEKRKIILPRFADAYEQWYSIAQALVKQVLPDRYEDFVHRYKRPKRKQITYDTYSVSDYLIQLQVGDALTPDAAIPQLRNQVDIVKAAESAFEDRLMDITQVLQADLFDSELEAATDLGKKGHCRAAGAVAGVVLEKHLAQVCAGHGSLPSKKNATINDYNQALKDSNVIDVPQWRFVQHLADIRNLCDHHKGADPTKVQVEELIAGVEKVTKTLF